MKDVFTFLDGKKTYIVAIAVIVFNYLIAQQVIYVDQSTVDLVNAILAACGLAALRVGISKTS